MTIRDFLKSRHIWHESLLHPPMSSSSKLAQVVHVPGKHVAKGVLIRAGEGYVLAVLPATSRIDLGRLSQILDGAIVTLATEDEVECVFGNCERGALPPFGRLYGLRTLVDASLAAGSEIVCVGNSRHEGVRLRWSDYEEVEAPIRARFAVIPEPRQRRISHRQAS